MELEKGTYYTVTQAAAMLEVPRSTVKNHCKQSNIGIKLDPELPRSAYLLTPADIDYIKSRLGKRGEKLT